MLRKYLLGSSIALTAVFAAYFAGSSVAQQAVPAHSYDYQIGAILYQQKSGEYRALAYQAYNLARLRLAEDLDKKNVNRLPKAERKRPPATIVDTEETILDNS